jgi:3-(3-hydroxy-phenyl)propionate hydroxylase
MLPQPQVTTLHGEKKLLDEVLGTGFALLCYSDKPGALHTALNELDKSHIWKHLDVRIVCVQPAIGIASESVASSAFPSHITIVRSNEISTFLRHDPNLFILVRPDRYIFGAFRHQQAAAFATTFQALLRA